MSGLENLWKSPRSEEEKRLAEKLKEMETRVCPSCYQKYEGSHDCSNGQILTKSIEALKTTTVNMALKHFRDTNA